MKGWLGVGGTYLGKGRVEMIGKRRVEGIAMNGVERIAMNKAMGRSCPWSSLPRRATRSHQLRHPTRGGLGSLLGPWGGAQGSLLGAWGGAQGLLLVRRQLGFLP